MKFKILVIDHSLQHIEEIKTTFGQGQMVEQIYEAGDGAEAVAILKAKEIDLVICNAVLPDMNGLELLKAIKAMPDRGHLPVIFVSSQPEMDFKAKAFGLGAQEFLIRPFEPEELLIRAKSLVHIKQTYDELHRRIRDLEKTANIDPLTGLFNRKYLMDSLRAELVRSRRHRFTVDCLMIDTDNFKTVNDTLGHTVGDQVLRELAQRLGQQLRGYDFAARYGGDEFVVLLPQSSKGGAVALAERLRHLVDSEPFLRREGRNIHLTISIGIAAFSGLEIKSEEQLITIADRALYEAKKVGRNCIAIAESPDQFQVEPPKGLYRRNYRRYQRYPFLVLVKLVDRDTQHSTTAYTINISYGGMALYGHNPIAEKSRIDVSVVFSDSSGKLVEENVKGTVRWVKQLNDHYGVGIEFEELSREEHPRMYHFIQEAERLSP